MTASGPDPSFGPPPSYPPGPSGPSGQQYPNPTDTAQGGQRNIVGLIALITAIVGFIFVCIPATMIIGWIILPAAFVLSIVGLVLSGKTKATSIAGLITSSVGTLVGVIVLIFVIGSAFDEAFTDEDIDITAPKQEPDDSPTTEEPDEVDVGEQGSRQDPVELGSTLSSSDWDITITSFDPDMTEAVLTENDFNDEPDDGNTYAVIEVEVTYTGDDSADPASDIDFAYVTEQGNTITDYDAFVVGPAPEIYDIGELYEGASGTGNVVLEIPQDDEGLLRVTPDFLADDVFVTTQ